jgi:hypothetical protein
VAHLLAPNGAFSIVQYAESYQGGTGSRAVEGRLGNTFHIRTVSECERLLAAHEFVVEDVASASLGPNGKHAAVRIWCSLHRARSMGST